MNNPSPMDVVAAFEADQREKIKAEKERAARFEAKEQAARAECKAILDKVAEEFDPAFVRLAKVEAGIKLRHRSDTERNYYLDKKVYWDNSFRRTALILRCEKDSDGFCFYVVTTFIEDTMGDREIRGPYTRDLTEFKVMIAKFLGKALVDFNA